LRASGREQLRAPGVLTQADRALRSARRALSACSRWRALSAAASARPAFAQEELDPPRPGSSPNRDLIKKGDWKSVASTRA
jgi:hypothetical protein